MTERTPEEIAAGLKLTEAQCRWLREICRTSGGGVAIGCRVLESGEVVPSNGPLRKLYEKDLIQGKAGGFSRVVHTRLGWSVNRTLIEKDNRRGG